MIQSFPFQFTGYTEGIFIALNTVNLIEIRLQESIELIVGKLHVLVCLQLLVGRRKDARAKLTQGLFHFRSEESTN